MRWQLTNTAIYPILLIYFDQKYIQQNLLSDLVLLLTLR